MHLEEMCDNDLVDEWSSFNDVLTDCPESQSDYDINMREQLEEEIVRRGGEFEVGTRTHVFNGFKMLEKVNLKSLSNLETSFTE